MSECAVPQFYHWSTPRARKRHRCVECNAPIEIGEEHFSWSGKWEGYISGGRQHLVCMEACMLIRDKFNDDCIPFGGLKDYCWEFRRDIAAAAKSDDPKDKWYFSSDATREDAKKLRSLLAAIKWRERKAGKS